MSSDVCQINRSLKYLHRHIESEGFAGYDPYDALMGWTDFRFLGKWVAAVLVQMHKRNPVNFRFLLGIPKMHNAKAIGLLLQAYSLLLLHIKDKSCATTMDDAKQSEKPTLWIEIHKRSLQDTTDALFTWLYENCAPGGRGWGYPFHWANPEKFLPAGTPSAVVTGFAAKGIYSYYQLTSDPRALELLEKAASFVLEDLSRTEMSDGVCFSYTPEKRDCCYNASLLAAEVLARLNAVSGKEELYRLAKRAVDFVIRKQHSDGHWNYSLDLDSGCERKQIDFHQGFVLESIHTISRLLKIEDQETTEALCRGAQYYRIEQFQESGRCKWRRPREWPADIHAQAQGMITFVKLQHLHPEYFSFATMIARWTILHMQDKRGYFYYQKHRYYTNRICYMRWSQAWMFLALTVWICAEQQMLVEEGGICTQLNCNCCG